MIPTGQVLKIFSAASCNSGFTYFGPHPAGFSASQFPLSAAHQPFDNGRGRDPGELVVRRSIHREGVMRQNLEETMAVLERTPGALDALLRGLPEIWTLRNEGEKTWSAFDVLGHLLHGERTDWLPRTRMILEFGESRTFEPFDRWAQERESAGKSLGELLDEFARLRAEGLRELRAMKLRPEDLARLGRHPEQGVVILGELLAAWAVHDLTHLHQISRVMAHQYREMVGPWQEYLGVLQCGGHSAP
jgi:hypothetical protein